MLARTKPEAFTCAAERAKSCSGCEFVGLGQAVTPVEVHILEKPVTELDSAWVQQVDAELRSHGDRLTSIEKTLAENNEATFEIRDILTAAKGAFRVLGWLGQGTAWALKFGAATVGFYAAIKALAPHWLANILPK